MVQIPNTYIIAVRSEDIIYEIFFFFLPTTPLLLAEVLNF